MKTHLIQVPHQRRSLPRIAITMGDPAGIGPEVVLKAVAEEEIQRVLHLRSIIGDAQLLAHTARTSICSPATTSFALANPSPSNSQNRSSFTSITLTVLSNQASNRVRPEKRRVDYIEAAVELCAAGSADAIATAPINKRSLFLGGL